MGSASQPGLFSLLPEARKPWREFVFSTASQASLIAVLLGVGVFHPQILHPPEHAYRSVELVATPAPVNHAPQRSLPQQAQLTPPASQALHLRAPRPQSHPETLISAPEVNIAASKLAPLPPSQTVTPKEAVKMNLFSTGSSAPQTVAKAPEKVQTGGFGDPNGLHAKSNEGKVVNVAELGSFDLPAGAGHGNGTDGANGARGVIASSGFGNGLSLGDAGANSPQKSIQRAGFGDAVAAAPASHNRMEEISTPLTPAEILSKPNPLYTEDARNLRIQGEVLLEVVLHASGTLQVVRVVRGLGHGLDDSAVHAAQQIRFKPAQRDGRPADSTAVLHIIFQLA